MMRPTFGDLRPTFGHPDTAVMERREPERPSVGVQLGMDGTELPALDVPEWYDSRPMTWVPEDEQC